MRVVLCGDFLFSSRHLIDRIDPKIVELLKGADAVFANAEFSTPHQDTPPWIHDVFNLGPSGDIK